MTILTVLSLAALIACFAYSHIMLIDAYTGALVANRFTGTMRPVGPGWHIIWIWEKIVNESETTLKESAYIFESDFETQDEATITLRIAFKLVPITDYLTEYQRFNSEDRLSDIKERIRSILSIKVRKLKNRDAVMDSLKPLGKFTKKCFEKMFSENGKSIEQHYGTNLSSLMISDAALPQELKDAATRREAQEKENETRQMEMDKIRQMAKDLVKESDGTMMYEDALRRIQVQLGKVEDKNETFGLDKGTQELIKAAIKEAFCGNK